MKKSSLLLLLIVPTSCVSFKPFVFTDAYLNPTTTTEITYENLNFSYALFNQFASGLSYSIRLDYSTYSLALVNGAVEVSGIPGLNKFTSWNTITSTYAEADLDTTWTNAFNSILFDRSFDRTTKKATTTKELVLIKQAGFSVVNFSIRIKSRINYKVNIGSVYLAFLSFVSVNNDNAFTYMYFYDADDVLLQTYLLTSDRSSTNRNYLFNLATIVTNVKSFDLQYQIVDTPPFDTGGALLAIRELNLFTQNQEIDIPDDATGDLFGFEFVAVEWWNFLGHAQNFLWWVVNKSPISPVFVWIDTYIITWFEGFFNFMEELFNL